MRLSLPALILALGLACGAAAQPVDTLKSDIATDYRPATAQADYVRREMMIPMRDGVRLYTVMVMRKGVAQAPILLERTPYGADGYIAQGASQALARIVPAADAPYVEDGYIRVWQDIRGRGRSEGVYVTNRPLSGPLNPTGVDHATDAYDTIDWLVRNTPEANGKVGVIGGSYAGFTTLMVTLSGHPALKAAVPINPMVDVWTGDDWYHNGAFRQITLNVLPIIMAGQGRAAPPPTGMVDLYALMLQTGSAGDYMRRFGLDGFPAAKRFVAHEAFDDWWRGQALDRLLAARPIRVPMLLVGGRYDEQDLYGAPAVFRALHPLDIQGKVSLLLGPWSHMGINGDGSRLGPVAFSEDTAATARRDVIKPFLDARLKTAAAPFDPPAVISYATGEGGGWRRSKGLPEATTPLFLRADGKLAFDPPKASEPAKDDYVSDPTKPVPVIARPFYFTGRSDSWKTSLIADQRVMGQRPDVLTFVTEPLESSVHVFGAPQVELFAATSGTDSDFVVKLIDVYPAEMADPDMGGYQLPVGMEIFRGRYLNDLAKASPLTPGKVEAWRFALPMADHVFAKGHRIMVQVQSSWFPVYDRNPQTFVPNIFEAKPQDYRKATQSVFHTPGRASAVRLESVYLDAAFTHPVGDFAADAAKHYVDARRRDPQAVGPRGNARREAVGRFARLVGVAAADIAVVPSTLDGENLVNLALGTGTGTGPGAGVVTDALHYDGSLALYGEMAKRGTAVAVARPREGRVDLADLRALITPQTRLVAVSLVSSTTGFEHDLAELCTLAHARGALVYADIVQAAGAIPLDLAASGVDFACCGTYKWLMGDYGTAFLYVRPDRLDRLKRVQVGWRQVRRQESHVLPFEPPGPALGDYELAQGAAGLFEVSTPAWGALAVAQASLGYILDLGVDAIARHRQPLIDQLQEALPALGFTPLTPRGSRSPVLAFAARDAAARFDARLKARGVRISTYPHRIRISPSVYNGPEDVARLIQALTV